MAGKKTKKHNVLGIVITLVIIVLLLGSMAAYSYFSNKVVFSSSVTPGNSAGNLYNGGLFCESGDRIYFSNPKDNYTLYSMSKDFGDFKKHYNDYARYINADENYIYYTRMNNKKENGTRSVFIFYSTGVYRLKKSNNTLAVITPDPSGSLLLYKNRLYYQVFKDNVLTLHRIGIDAQDDIRLVTDDTPVVSALNDNIYYAARNEDHAIHEINSSGVDSVVVSADAHMPIATSKGFYYVDLADSYRLKFQKADGGKPETAVDATIAWYNISDDGRFIFYSTDDEKTAGIYVIDTVLEASEKILDGNYKWINLAGDTCFFFDFSKETAYAYNYRSGQLNEFNPPISK